MANKNDDQKIENETISTPATEVEEDDELELDIKADVKIGATQWPVPAAE